MLSAKEEQEEEAILSDTKAQSKAHDTIAQQAVKQRISGTARMNSKAKSNMGKVNLLQALDRMHRLDKETNLSVRNLTTKARPNQSQSISSLMTLSPMMHSQKNHLKLKRQETATQAFKLITEAPLEFVEELKRMPSSQLINHQAENKSSLAAKKEPYTARPKFDPISLSRNRTKV